MTFYGVGSPYSVTFVYGGAYAADNEMATNLIDRDLPSDVASQIEARGLEGAERWLDSAKPGRPEKAAAAIARAIERGRRRLIYPRRMSPSYELPLLGRLYSAAAARGFEPERIAVRRTGWRAEDAQPPSDEGPRSRNAAGARP